jgi:thiol-disulfide isomerase/thioredoxin
MKRICSLILSITLFISCSKPGIKPTITGKEGSPILAFNIALSDTTHFFNTAAIQKGSPTILFFFSPGCPYCKMTTRKIIDNMEEFKRVRFCFISYDPMEKIRGFGNRYKMDQYKNIWIGRDTGYVFHKYFKSKSVPFLAVYGSDNKLKSTFKGALSKEQLETFLKL